MEKTTETSYENETETNETPVSDEPARGYLPPGKKASKHSEAREKHDDPNTASVPVIYSLDASERTKVTNVEYFAPVFDTFAVGNGPPMGKHPDEYRVEP